LQTEKNAAIEPELLERARRVAQDEGVSVDELASQALQRELGRRSLERFKREGEARRGELTDEQVESIVETAIREVRGR